jgi:hypothetical protein
MKSDFPTPTIFGRQRHWRLSDLLAYEHALAKKPLPDPLPAADERYLTAAQVRERYSVSDMWLHRRLKEREGETSDVEVAA